MYATPPYLLLIVGLLTGITSGLAFEATLKQSVQDWARNRSTRTLANMRGMQLSLPFFGISFGICLFLASGLGIFGFPAWLAYGAAVPLTIFTAVLVWSQLGANLVLLEQGGSRAIDLDAFE